MGITIHYSGKLKSPELITKVRDELEDIAKDMNWQYSIMDEDLYKPNTAKLVVNDLKAEITEHLPLKGIIINIHKDCESLTFYFDKDGILRNSIAMTAENKDEDNYTAGDSVKTQFAPLDVHITIIKLLKYLKEKYFEEFDVYDEGGYWETGDENVLKTKMKFLSAKIDAVGKILAESEDELKDCKSPEDLVAKLEAILKTRLR